MLRICIYSGLWGIPNLLLPIKNSGITEETHKHTPNEHRSPPPSVWTSQVHLRPNDSTLYIYYPLWHIAGVRRCTFLQPLYIQLRSKRQPLVFDGQTYLDDDKQPSAEWMVAKRCKRVHHHTKNRIMHSSSEIERKQLPMDRRQKPRWLIAFVQSVDRITQSCV